jgi:transposase, IS5 family
MMRNVQNPQLQFGQVDISKIQFNSKSRDDIPQILKGLQYIYSHRALREEIFALLEKNIAPQINKQNGRPGMELWKILVLGVLRLDLNCDYDRIEELANHHDTIRFMLGHNGWDDPARYHLQTLKDNIGLLTPELLDQINKVVVNAGHVLVKKKETTVLRGRCDSFVVKTNVHYPTDINLLFDAMRKVITLTADLSEGYGLSDWRQHNYNVNHVKRLMRTAQNKKRYSGRTEEQQRECAKKVKEAHCQYIKVSQAYLSKACLTIEKLEKQGLDGIRDCLRIENIKEFVVHAKRQINQIDRRILRDEIIPHYEKVFSIFEPHTEWVCKGKAGVPVELGLRVCVLEDQYKFILHHQVMEKQTDDQIAISMVEEAQKYFPELKIMSFDKGFHSPKNQEALSEKLALLALPRKGKLSKKAHALEQSEAFRKARRHHSAVESAINALEVHGLDLCPDHGIYGFKRYVALAIVARNIQIIGAILQKHEHEQLERRRKKYNSRDGTMKFAA